MIFGLPVVIAFLGVAVAGIPPSDGGFGLALDLR